jgi:hypothetical protein
VSAKPKPLDPETKTAIEHGLGVTAVRIERVLQGMPLAKLVGVEPDKAKAVLLQLTQEVYQAAMSRKRMTNRGPVYEPDSHGAVQALRLAAALLGVENLAPSVNIDLRRDAPWLSIDGKDQQQ